MTGNAALAEAVSEAYRRPRKRLTHCPRGHEFTPENTKVDRDGRHRCRACHRARSRANRRGERLEPVRKSTMPPNCVCCGIKLVRHRETPTEGTRRHISKGHCTTCYDRVYRPKEVQRAMKAAAQQRIAETVHANNVAGRDRFLERRRARGVPADGRPLAHTA